MTITTQTKQDESNQATTEFLSGKLAHVDIARIERELKELWRSASESGSEEGSLAVTRACAMNLILYSDSADAETIASDMLDEITVRHPCRAILAICRAAEKPSLEAWVSARCHLTGSKKDKQICCEQITVRSEGQSTKELASVVKPLLVSDLPVFMWLNKPGFELSALEPFLPSLDRLILDSADLDDSLRFFEDVLKILDDKVNLRCNVTVSDLNWNRSLSWRESLALAFEDRYGKLSLSHLDKIESVEINYGLDQARLDAAREQETMRFGLLNQSLLLASWLATRLKWQVEQVRVTSVERVEVEFSSSGGKRIVKLNGVSWEQAGTGDIGAITIKFAGEEEILRASQPKGMPGIAVTCCKDGSNDLKTEGGKTLELYEPAESVVVDRELQQHDRDPIFRQALIGLVQILSKLHAAGKAAKT